uniref:Cilia- and flagella-associated protein 300 n=2 Tax=Nothobranchius kuhntae TaxID=321403 RepID=A0A1A8JFS8_NOTKU
MAAEGDEFTFARTFSFSPLPMKKFSFLQDKNTSALLMKWSMLGRISAHSYSFDNNFCPHSSERFALSFFRDPEVISSLRNMESRIPVPFDKPVVSVSVEHVPCTKTSMELFDPIYSCGVLRPSGDVVKCFSDVYTDCDELQLMLQDEGSKHYHSVERKERKEFLFRIFKHLRLGGELCEYEDHIDPYISTTKQIYKDLISVRKDADTKQICVVSTVLKVSAYDGSGRCFPGTPEQEQTFAYMIVDPFKRHVNLFSHFYGVGNFSP